MSKSHFNFGGKFEFKAYLSYYNCNQKFPWNIFLELSTFSGCSFQIIHLFDRFKRQTKSERQAHSTKLLSPSLCFQMSHKCVKYVHLRTMKRKVLFQQYFKLPQKVFDTFILIILRGLFSSCQMLMQQPLPRSKRNKI